MDNYENERDMWDSIVENERVTPVGTFQGIEVFHVDARSDQEIERDPVEKLKVSKVQFVGGTTSVLKLGKGMVTIDLDTSPRWTEDEYDTERDHESYEIGYNDRDTEYCEECGLTVDADAFIAGMCRSCYQWR